MNTVEDPKVAAERLMQRAYNRDGLPELAVGLSLLVLASLIYGTAVLPKRSPFFVADVLGFALGCPLLGLLKPRLVKWVRGRYLTDRVGYVLPKRRAPKVLWYGILSSVAVAFALFLGNHFIKGDRWLLLSAGFAGAAILILSAGGPARPASCLPDCSGRFRAPRSASRIFRLISLCPHFLGPSA
jgi:hypothetical protein